VRPEQNRAVNAERFPELPGRERQTERAAELLTRAASAVTALTPAAETWGEQAERLRGAATFAQTAAAELLSTAGYLEAADAAERAGLLEAEPEV
jgi:hypothetical protein